VAKRVRMMVEADGCHGWMDDCSHLVWVEDEVGE
jgi:hypothetical protein